MPSPLVTTFLLVLISLTSLTITILWMLAVPQTPSEPFFTEWVRIEAVSVDGNIVKVFVRNVMSRDVEVSAVSIVNGTSGVVVAQNVSKFRIRGGDAIVINIELMMKPPPGVYIAKVITSRGYVASYIFMI